MESLRTQTMVLLSKSKATFGYDDTLVRREIGKALDPNWQANLLDFIASVIKVPGFWSTPRSILEMGCGAGYLTLNAMRGGHDAWGIDSDPDRLAIGYERITTFGWNPEWNSHLVQGDAMATHFDPDRFDLVIGHQFIEHVPDPAGTISEMMRVTKRGGYVVLFAPDYRAPFEAHYEIPWPPFLARDLCKSWLDGFERPYGGIDNFYYTSLSQVVGIFEPMNCRIVNAYNDRRIEPQVMRHFDCSTAQATLETARKFRAAFDARQLPENFMIATSFGIAAQKL